MDTSHLSEEHRNNHRIMRTVLIAVVVIGIGLVSYLGYTNPTLFQAAITGGSSPRNTDKELYVPIDYVMEAGDSGNIMVKAGKDIDKLEKFKVTLYAPTNQLTFITASKIGTVLSDENCVPANDTTNGLLTLECGDGATGVLSKDYDIKANDILASFTVQADSSLSKDETIVISYRAEAETAPATGWKTHIQQDGQALRIPTFDSGKITIGEDAKCQTLQCGSYGQCINDACVCSTGYTGTFCDTCDTANGYSGYPSCTKTSLGNVGALILTLHDDTISKLTDAEKDLAYSSAYVFVNATTASGAGKILSIDGNDLSIPAYSSGTTTAERLDSMADAMKATIDGYTGVNASKVPGVSGVLKLEANSANPDGTLDPITTTSGDVVFVPGMNYTIKLHPNDSYKLRILARDTDNDAKMIDLNYNNVTWKPQPMNRLSDTALKGGLLERGDKSGLTPLYAQVDKTSGLTIDSNQLSVEVESAPLIEYVRRIGTSVIEKGGRINLSVKLIDTETISDIKDISTSIVRSTGTTYSAINADTSAAWFTATPFETEVKTSDSGTQTGSDGQTSENYKIYSIPVEIPQDENLTVKAGPTSTAGDYKLVIEITDTSGKVSAGILSIVVGSISSGDVNGDGKVSMLDVIMAFNIQTGNIANPTQSQLQAADMNNDGKVTMLDVINLFNQL